MKRRGFLNWFLGLGFVGTFIGFLVPILGYLLPVKEAGGEREVDAGPMDNWPDGTADITAVGGRAVLIVHMHGAYRAYSPLCTHLGCLVQWDDDRQRLTCPCHGAVFRADGVPVSGPADKPLQRLALRVADDHVFIGGPV